MAKWLFKEEPDHYSYDDLVRDGKAVWTGVTNALARKHLSQTKVGDRVFYYHTGKQKAIVGEMRVVSGPKPDPDSDDPKSVIVEIAPVRAFAEPITLAVIKGDAELATWDLVRLPRLSVLPVSEAQWQRVLILGNADR